MKRLLYLAAKLYPAGWRDRYGAEFDALLNEGDFGLKDWLDVWKGALALRLRSAGIVTLVFLAAGALAGGFVSWRIPRQYSSTATLRFELLQGGDQASAADAVRRLLEASLSPDSLAAVIQQQNLIDSRNKEVEQFASKLRSEIRVDLAAATHPNESVFRITFQDRDRTKMERVANALAGSVIGTNLRLALAHARPEGLSGTVQLLSPPAVGSWPRGLDRLRIVGWGGVIGLGIGLLAQWLWSLLPRERPAG